MAICKEERREENKTEAKGKGAIVPIMAAKQWPHKTGSLFLQRKHSLSVTFLRDFQGVVLKLYQAPERTRNFVTFLPTGSQLKLSLEVPQSTSLPRENNSVKMLDWNTNTETLHLSKIIKTLREMVKRAVMEFRLSSSPPLNLNEGVNFNDVVEAIPVSFRPPQPTCLDMVLSPKKRVTTLLVGETLVSFQLPHNCPFDPEDLDKLAEEGRNGTMTLNINEDTIYNVPRFTFLQRLDGWKLERRQRVNGRFDMYYHHLPSRRVFRSITEVVNFFMYEVYPDKPAQKSATRSKLGEDDLSGKKTETKEKRATPLKRKIEESKKPREKWQPIYDLNADIQKAYDQNPIHKVDDDQKANGHHHIPIFDLNVDHQKGDEDQEIPFYDLDDHHQKNPNCDVVGDNYQEAKDDHHKETVEKFLAEAYDNLLNLPHAQKSKSFSFDINEKVCEEVEEEDGNFNPNNQTIEELLAEAYNNLINYHKNEARLQKGKEKRGRCIDEKEKEKEKGGRRRKKVKSFSPTSFPNYSSMNINSITKEKKKLEKGKEKEKENRDEDEDDDRMEMKQKASCTITNVKHNNKRFNIKEVNGKIIFTEVLDCEPSYGGGSCSAMEVAKSVAFFHMDECDLINHIPQSSDMFDLAIFLANNRGHGHGGFF